MVSGDLGTEVLRGTLVSQDVWVSGGLGTEVLRGTLVSQDVRSVVVRGHVLRRTPQHLEEATHVSS